MSAKGIANPISLVGIRCGGLVLCYNDVFTPRGHSETTREKMENGRGLFHALSKLLDKSY